LVGAWDGRRATRYTWDDGGQLASAPAPQMSGFLSDFERFSGVDRLLRSSDAGEYELIDSLLQKDSGIGLDFFGVQQPGADQMAHWKQLASVAERESDKNPFLADSGTEAQGWNLLSQYGYDVFGQPDSRQVPPSSVTEYLTDRGHTIQQLDGQGKSAGDAVYGAGWDTLLAWRPGEGGQPLYPVRDAMGTVNGAVTHDGSLEDSAAYDPWGKPTRPDASSPLPGFQGRPYESSTGLYQLRARYYSPELGRFISPDPAVDPLRPKTLNGYAFGFNNPLRYGDPTGLFSWKKAAAWAGVAICSAVLVGALALTAPVWFPAFAITAAVLFGSSLLLGTAYFNFNPPGC